MEKQTPTDAIHITLGDSSLPLRYTVAATKALVKALKLKNVQELLEFQWLFSAPVDGPIEHLSVLLHHGLSKEDRAIWTIEKLDEEIPLHMVTELCLAAVSAINNSTPERLKAAGEAAASEKKVNGISSLSTGPSPESISASPTPNTGTPPSEN